VDEAWYLNGPGDLAHLAQGQVQFTERQRRQFERQLAEHGRGSLEKSRATLERRLAEHLQKLEELQRIGGHTSSIEREIRNFQQQIDAVNEILRREP
jgi:wobble nucleotide-excising tRNase